MNTSRDTNLKEASEPVDEGALTRLLSTPTIDQAGDN